MSGRQVALYFSWSRQDEVAVSLGTLEDRFPALFELRRLFWPRLEQFADPLKYDQGIAGFLDHLQLTNFNLFADSAGSWTGNPVRRAERRTSGGMCALDAQFLSGVDTLIIIGFDSCRTQQHASEAEVAAIRSFLDNPDHTVFVCLHHDIGDASKLPPSERLARQELEFHHHGDPAIPAKQCFGSFGTSLLLGLDLPVKNRFGLRPEKLANGTPAALTIASEFDRDHLMEGVTTFNLHPHLPHFERLNESLDKLDVLARQLIDLSAPPHPFTAGGRVDFDALLQTKAGVFAGRLLICDTTIWSSTVGGLESLQRFWRNVAMLKRGF
jgi:hypothetical protein